MRKVFPNSEGFVGKIYVLGIERLKGSRKTWFALRTFGRKRCSRKRKICFTRPLLLRKKDSNGFPKSSHCKIFHRRFDGRKKMWQWQWQTFGHGNDVMGIEFFELLSLTIHRVFSRTAVTGRQPHFFHTIAGAPIICLLINKRIIFKLRLLLYRSSFYVGKTIREFFRACNFSGVIGQWKESAHLSTEPHRKVYKVLKGKPWVVSIQSNEVERFEVVWMNHIGA